MSKPTKAKLHGYAKSPLGLPGMVIPVFKVGDGCFVQDTGKNGLVSRFEEIDVTKSDELMPAAAALTLAVGDEPVYAVALDEQHIIMGTKAGLVTQLDFADARMAELPELRADLAEFVENEAAFKQAILEIEERDAQAKAKEKAALKEKATDKEEATEKAESSSDSKVLDRAWAKALKAWISEHPPEVNWLKTLVPELRSDLMELVENEDALEQALQNIEKRDAEKKAKEKAALKEKATDKEVAEEKPSSDSKEQDGAWAKALKAWISEHPLEDSWHKKLAAVGAGEKKFQKIGSVRSTNQIPGLPKLIVDNRANTSIYGALESSGWLKEHASLEPEQITIKKLPSASSGQLVLVTVTTGHAETHIMVSLKDPGPQNLIELLNPQAGGVGHHGVSFIGGKKRVGHGSHAYDKRLSERHSPHEEEVYIMDW